MTLARILIPCPSCPAPRSLGLPYASAFNTTQDGGLPVWVSQVQCSGRESDFGRCRAWGWLPVDNCAGSSRAAAVCSAQPIAFSPPPPSAYACEWLQNPTCDGHSVSSGDRAKHGHTLVFGVGQGLGLRAG